jgi:hypothetical protein
MSPETKKRRSRFRREDEPSVALDLQGRDVAMVKALYEYRFLNTSQLKFLFPGAKSNLNLRLQKLYLHGYLDRPESQSPRWGETVIHALGQRGAQLLEDAKLYEGIAYLNWKRKNEEVTPLFLDHALAVSEFMAVLEKASEEKQGISLFQRVANDRAKLRTEVKTSRESFNIEPDAWFILQRQDGQKKFFILEVDRSTADPSRYLERLERYFKWLKSGQFERAYHFKTFRLLTVIFPSRKAENTQRRKTNLLKVASQIKDTSGDKIFSFWFATADDLLDRKNPQKIFNKVWLTPKLQEKLSILD